MKAHGFILASSFIPYFVLEAFKVEAPMINMGSLNSTYAWSPMVQLLLLMLASMSCAIAYCEIKEKMPKDVFAYYHFPLSAAILLWQMDPKTTTMGIVFMSMPHLFTVWGSVEAFKPASKKKASKPAASKAATPVPRKSPRTRSPKKL